MNGGRIIFRGISPDALKDNLITGQYSIGFTPDGELKKSDQGEEPVDLNGYSSDPRDFILLKSSKENIGSFLNSLSLGVVQSNTNFILPDNSIYVLSGVESFLKFAEACRITGGNSSYLSKYPFSDDTITHKLSLVSSIETSLKFFEAMGYTSDNLSDLNVSWSGTNFSDNFLSLINNLGYIERTDITKPEFLDIIIDKGIVEFNTVGNKSKIDYYDIIKNFDINIETYLGITNAYNTPFLSIMNMIMDRGLVVYTFNGIMTVSSIESFLKLIEVQKSNESGPVPA